MRAWVTISKLDLAAASIIASGMLWIEHGHRIVVATPASVEFAPAVAPVCPDTDDVPFSAECIRFIDGGVLPDLRSRPSEPTTPPEALGRAALQAPACPASNENTPYSTACINFLSGWHWHPNQTE
jgi:hypothetical protein